MFSASIPTREPQNFAAAPWASVALRICIYCLLVILPLGFVAIEVARWVRDIPNWDEFDTVLDFLIALDIGAGPGDVMQRLFAVNNEHRMLASRLMFAGSFWIFGSVDFAALAIVGNLFLIGMLVAVVEGARETAPRWRLAAIFALVVFQLQHHESLFWGGSSIDHFFVVMAALAAFGALGWQWRWALPIACGWGFIATFSLAHGLLVWPIGFALLWLQNRRRDAAMWAAATGVTLLLYFVNFHVNPGHTTPTLAQFPKLIVFWLRVMGSSAALDDVTIAPWLGGVLVGTTIFVFRRGCAERERLACAGIVWCLGATAMIAWGRALISIEWAPITSRYVILSSVAWALLAWVIVERGLARRGGRAWWLPLVFVGLVAFNLAADRVNLGAGREFARRLENAANWHHRHGTFANTATPIYPDPARADAVLAEAQGRGIYRLPPPEKLTLPLVSRLTLKQPQEIGDAFFFIDEVSQRDGEVKVRGWAFRPDHTTRFGGVSVVFRSAAGLFAFEPMPQLRPDVAAVYERADATYSGFELRLPQTELPAGEFHIGVCFGTLGDDSPEFMMTAMTVAVGDRAVIAKSEDASVAAGRP